MGVKYRYIFFDPTNTVWNVDIEDPDYTGAITTLKGGNNPLQLSLSPRSSNVRERRWTRAPGRIVAQISDQGTGLLTELIDNTTPNTYQINAYPTIGLVVHGLRGFIEPGDYGYVPFINGQISQIIATDNLGLLDRYPYTQDNGDLFTGEALLKDVVHQCLRRTGLNLGYAFHNMIYPELVSNPLSYDEDVMSHLLVDQERFIDDNGNPASCGYVLDQVLSKFNLRCYQWAGRWRIDHRVKDTDSASGGSNFRSYLYDSSGAALPGVGFYDDQPSLYTISDAGDYCWARDPVVSGKPALGTVSNIYLHQNPFVDLFGNLGFEEVILNSGDDGTWFISNSNNVNRDQMGVDDSANSLRFRSSYQLNSNIPVEDYATDFARQTSRDIIAGGNGRRLRLQFKVMVDKHTDTELYMPFKIYNDQGYYYDWNNSQWNQSDTLNLVPLVQFNFALNRFDEFTVVTPLLEDTGVPFDSKVTIEIRNPVEAHDALVGSDGNVFMWIDDVKIDLIDANNQLPAEALRVIAARTDSAALDSGVERVHLIGNGPTAGHVASLHVLDSTLARREVVDQYKYGAGSAPQYTLEQLVTVMDLEEYQDPLRVITGDVVTDIGLIIPPFINYNVLLPGDTLREYSWTQYTLRPGNKESFLSVEMEEIRKGAPPAVLVTQDIFDFDSESGTGFMSGANFGSTTIIQGTGGSGIEVVESVAVLSTLSVGGEDRMVHVESYHAGSGIGGGLFLGDTSDTSTPVNTGTVFIAADGKRWKRVIDATYNPTWWGARFDGVTDDAAAWQNMIDDLLPGSFVKCPRGVSVIGTGLVVNGKALTFSGAGTGYWGSIGYEGWTDNRDLWPGTKIVSSPTLTEPIFTVKDDINFELTTPPTGDPYWSGGRDNACHFEKIFFAGNRTSLNGGGTGTDDCGIILEGAWGAKVIDCVFVAFSIRGLRARSVTHDLSALGGPSSFTVVTDVCHIERCQMMDCGTYGIEWNGADSWLISNRCSFNTTGLVIGTTNNHVQGGYYDLNVVQGIRVLGSYGNTIESCFINSNGGNGIRAGNGTQSIIGLTVANCDIGNNGKDESLGIQFRAGLMIDGGKDWSIVGNKFFEFEANVNDPEITNTQTYDIFFSGDWFNHSIENNSFGGSQYGSFNMRTEDVLNKGWNPLMHGVIQGGVNDASRLQAMIDEMVDGDWITIPPDFIQLHETVVINKRITIRGSANLDREGIYGSYFYAGSALAGPLFQIDSPGVVFENINLIAHSSQTSSSAKGIVINAKDCQLRNCVVSNFKGDNIEVTNFAEGSKIINVYSKDSSGNGLLCQASRVVVENSIFVENNKNGISLSSGRNSFIRDCRCRGNLESGIRLDTGFYNKIMGGVCRSNGFNGVHVRSGQNHSVMGVDCINNGTFVGVLSNSKKAGIFIEEGENIHVVGNQCSDEATGATQTYGISFGSGLASASAYHNTGAGFTLAFFEFSASSAGNVNIDIPARFSYNAPSLAASGTDTVTVNVAGARGGDSVKVGVPDTHNPLVIVQGFVTNDDQVTIVFFNTSAGAIDLVNGDYSLLLSRRNDAVASTGSPSGSTDPLIEFEYRTGENLLPYS